MKIMFEIAMTMGQAELVVVFQKQCGQLSSSQKICGRILNEVQKELLKLPFFSYICVVLAALRLWLVLLPLMPVCLHIVRSLLCGYPFQQALLHIKVQIHLWVLLTIGRGRISQIHMLLVKAYSSRCQRCILDIYCQLLGMHKFSFDTQLPK